MLRIGLLLRVFNDCVDRRINVEEKDDRIILQKIVFLFRFLGVSFGDYCFSMETYGPYSQNLNNDIYSITNESKMFDGKLPDKIQKKIDYIKNEIIDKKPHFSDNSCVIQNSQTSNYTFELRKWLEEIATIICYKKYIRPSLSLEDIDKNIIKAKKYLDNPNVNKMAIERCYMLLQVSA